MFCDGCLHLASSDQWWCLVSLHSSHIHVHLIGLAEVEGEMKLSKKYQPLIRSFSFERRGSYQHYFNTSHINRIIIIFIGSHVLPFSPAASAGSFLPSELHNGTACKWSRIVLFRVSQKTVPRSERCLFLSNQI
ncbi:hypothetical protein KOW79_006867 [Hemibagrus wyckioides]|uniref:Uncharacterized protein n=1 Tax=Hemibagrus wyckioides TaxID=337641 RepID=A0A9D3P0H0_9TELE|nr:hypothetical protein KOW79_006867 [Hemibagrus wyckioides]